MSSSATVGPWRFANSSAPSHLLGGAPRRSLRERSRRAARPATWWRDRSTMVLGGREEPLASAAWTAWQDECQAHPGAQHRPWGPRPRQFKQLPATITWARSNPRCCSCSDTGSNWTNQEGRHSLRSIVSRVGEQALGLLLLSLGSNLW